MEEGVKDLRKEWEKEIRDVYEKKLRFSYAWPLNIAGSIKADAILTERETHSLASCHPSSQLTYIGHLLEVGKMGNQSFNCILTDHALGQHPELSIEFTI